MKNIHPHFDGDLVLSFSRLFHLCLPPHSDQTVLRNILHYEKMFDRWATLANKACTRGMSTQSQTDSVTCLVLVRARHNFRTNRLINELTLMYVCCTKLFDR